MHAALSPGLTIEQSDIENDNEVIRLTLDDTDADAFIQAERVIREGLQTFFEVGTALAAIRDNRWYCAKGYATFESYCEEEWSFTDRRAGMLIDAAIVANNLLADQPLRGTMVPLNERLLRPLTKIDASDQGPMFDEAVTNATERGERVAARHVEEVVKRHAAPKKAQASASSNPTEARDDRPYTGPDHEPAPSEEHGQTTIFDVPGVAYSGVAEFRWQGPFYRLKHTYKDGFGNSRQAYSEIEASGPATWSITLNGTAQGKAGSLDAAKRRIEDLLASLSTETKKGARP